MPMEEKVVDEPKFPPETLGEKIAVYTCIALLTIIPFIFIIVCIGFAIHEAITENTHKTRMTPAGRRESNVEEYGEYIYLKKVDDSSYKLVSETDPYDKKIGWDSKYYSYSDRSYNYYVWYDSSSKEWEYWDNDISGNYGSYGWMKCEDLGWEIEEDENTWVRLPEEYDRNKIWHIINE
jgi:hypothetical protein